MEFLSTCKHCKGSGKTTTTIRVGSIIQPTDGSSMCNALHKMLWNGEGRTNLPLPQNEAFKPVRVVAIEGNMLAVVPLHWEDRIGRITDRQDDKCYAAMSSIWTGNPYKHVATRGFWIHAYVTAPIIIQE
jgi:hypothetical protein